MASWNQDLNPIPAEAQALLKNCNKNIDGDANPVEDLTNIMLQCYEMLSTISAGYTSTGNSRSDSSVRRVNTLLENWSPSHIETLRQNAALECQKPTHEPPPPPPEISCEKEGRVEQPSSRSENSTPTLPNSSTDGTNYSKPIAKSTSTPSLSTKTGRSSKNNEYFLKLKEDEALAKKKQEEEEAKMKPEALKKLQEERRLAEAHDSSKTAHLSKLGSKYMPSKKKSSTDSVMDRGGGGRGRGRGRGH